MASWHCFLLYTHYYPTANAAQYTNNLAFCYGNPYCLYRLDCDQ
jgi:hypothetical protein